MVTPEIVGKTSRMFMGIAAGGGPSAPGARSRVRELAGVASGRTGARNSLEWGCIMGTAASPETATFSMRVASSCRAASAPDKTPRILGPQVQSACDISMIRTCIHEAYMSTHRRHFMPTTCYLLSTASTRAIAAGLLFHI